MEFLLLRRVLWRSSRARAAELERHRTIRGQSRLDGDVDRLVAEFAVAFFDRATEELAEQARTTRSPACSTTRRSAATRLELERAARYRHGVTLVFLDLDDFKGINDTPGHPAGDRVLRAVAALLRDRCAASDLAGRMGGDEFAVCLVEAEAEAGAGFIARLHGRVDGLMPRAAAGALSISAGFARFPAEAGRRRRALPTRRRAALRGQALQLRPEGRPAAATRPRPARP